MFLPGKFCAWSYSKHLPLSHLISTREQQESLYSMASSKSETSISGDLLEKAKKELNEDPQTRRVEVKNLAKRLEKVPGKTRCLNFLRGTTCCVFRLI